MLNITIPPGSTSIDPHQFAGWTSPVRDVAVNCLGMGDGILYAIAPLTGGRSDCSVVLFEYEAHPGNPRQHCVFKIGPRDLLLRELDGYLSLSAGGPLPATFIPIRETTCTRKFIKNASPDDICAIQYVFAQEHFAGGHTDSLGEVLTSYLLGTTDGPTEEDVQEIIRSLESSLGALRQTASQRDNDFVIRNYYRRGWAPNYTVEPGVQFAPPNASHRSPLFHSTDQPLPAFTTITPQPPHELARRSERIADDVPVNVLALNNLMVTYWNNNTELYLADQGEDFCVRLDLSPSVASKAKKTIDGNSGPSRVSLWAMAGQSRVAFYHERLGKALPETDLKAQEVKIQNICFTNPLLNISGPLEHQPGVGVKKGKAHGDLHIGNVLVVNGRIPTIIDYGLSEDNLPVGIDQARLFGTVVRDVVAKRLTFGELASVLANVFEPDDKVISLYDNVMRRSYLLLKDLLRAVLSSSGLEDRIFYRHLYGFCWIGLRWISGGVSPYRACFLLAGLAAAKIGGYELQRSCPEAADLKIYPSSPDGGADLRSINYSNRAKEAIRAWGKGMAEEGRWDWLLINDALMFCEYALFRDPCNANAWSSTAYIFHLLNDKTTSEKCLTRMGQLDSDSTICCKHLRRAIDHDASLDGDRLERAICPNWFDIDDHAELIGSVLEGHREAAPSTQLGRMATEEVRNRLISNSYHNRGRDKIREWGDNWARGNWDWFLLAHAIQDYLDAIRYDPYHQQPWTNLAYAYHLVGLRDAPELARMCLMRSELLARPGPNHPGNNHRKVRFAISTGGTLSSAEPIQRPEPPDDYLHRFGDYLVKGFTVNTNFRNVEYYLGRYPAS